MSKKKKRAAILAVIIYIMINILVWGLMKVYINSYNAVSSEQLVMAQITDSSKGKEISVMGKSVCIPSDTENDSDAVSAIKTLIPLKIRAVTELFRQTGQAVVQELH